MTGTESWAAGVDPRATTAAFPVTTTFQFPGGRTERSLGPCFGLVVRSMGALKGIAAGFRSMVGGEVTQYTELLEDSRRHAIDRMIENARLNAE
ncbi:MAG TPA: heavy metal-binding domain-containing protein [Acidimicrobiia bacterium]|nr:heavy metal-binding domain-containing protein [Acidimicrobiia bacterium]